MEWEDLTAAELGRGIDVGKIDPVELAQYFLDRIDAVDSSREIFFQVTKERALKEAEASRRRVRAGNSHSPLDGVPVSWKDLYDTKGVVCESGAPLLAGRVAVADCEVLSIAGKAGMVCLGKTHQTEFAFSGIGINPKTATPPNALLPGCVPGGSSSGAGASVAFGLAPIAIGSDTGGSVRIPACWNSLVGLKTTHGLISTKGVIPLCSGFDTVGPLAKSVEDAALMFEVLGGGSVDLGDLPTPSQLHFVIVETLAMEGCDAIQMGAFENAVKALEGTGAKVTTMKSELFAEAMELGKILFPYEAWRQWGDLISANPGVMFAPVEERFRQGESIVAQIYEEAFFRLRQIRLEFFDGIRNADGVIMPTLAVQPPRIDDLMNDLDLFTTTNLLGLRNTRFGNMFGTCAMTLPLSVPAAGLQLMGKPGEDVRLVQISAAIEQMVKNA